QHELVRALVCVQILGRDDPHSREIYLHWRASADFRSEATSKLNVEHFVCNKVACHAYQVERRLSGEHRGEHICERHRRPVFRESDRGPRHPRAIHESGWILSGVERAPGDIARHRTKLAKVFLRSAPAPLDFEKLPQLLPSCIGRRTRLARLIDDSQILVVRDLGSKACDVIRTSIAAATGRAAAGY
ncbi:MAG: hypothetical protein ACRELY_15845, partial [Polyangiaceae bacterium]